MQTRDSSFIQAFADRHPFLMLPYHIAQGKFATPTLKFPPDDIKFKCEPAEYREGNELIAQLKFYDDLPVIEVYSDDSALRAKAQMHLTAKYFMQLYLQYLQFLFPAARVQSHTPLTDPIEFTNAEIRRRQLDFSAVEPEMHYMLTELNKYIAEYNESASALLQLNFFTMEDLQAMYALCDVYKGIGCSAAVKEGTLIRNLDWLPLNALAAFSVAVMSKCKNDSGVSATFSIGFMPGVLGLSIINDKGLMITINEATRMPTMRTNEHANAVPQFVLLREIAENCTTIDEVKAFLQKPHHEPASSHILTVLDVNGDSGVFEILPNRGYAADKLFAFRGHQGADRGEFEFVTNHFVDENHAPLADTDASDSSVERYNALARAIAATNNPLAIATSTSKDATVQTLIYQRYEDKMHFYFRAANGFAAQQPSLKADINLTERFDNFLATHNVTYRPGENVDKLLLNLLAFAHEVAAVNPILSKELTQYYSGLVELLAKSRAGTFPFDVKHIEYLADQIVLDVKLLLADDLTAEQRTDILADYCELTYAIDAKPLQDLAVGILSGFAIGKSLTSEPTLPNMALGAAGIGALLAYHNGLFSRNTSAAKALSQSVEELKQPMRVTPSTQL